MRPGRRERLLAKYHGLVGQAQKIGKLTRQFEEFSRVALLPHRTRWPSMRKIISGHPGGVTFPSRVVDAQIKRETGLPVLQAAGVTMNPNDKGGS